MVYHEKKWNYTLCFDYLRGKTSHISLSDTNHNIKNLRYQIIGGSSPASFGFYEWDHWLLKISVCVTKEVTWFEYYPSDAAVILLASLKLIKDFIDLNSRFCWQLFCYYFLIFFLIMRSFDVNSRRTFWKDRDVFSW